MQERKNSLDIYTASCMVVVTLFAFLISMQKVYNYDIWWHLKLGNHALQNLVIPNSDILSFSTEGAAWINLYWLSDPLFALIHNHLGMNGLLIFKSLVIACAALFLFLFVVRAGLSPLWSAAMMVVVLDLSRFRFMLRPLVFQFAGIVFLLWFLYRMEKFRYRGALLFVVMVVWGGLHGSAFIAQVGLIFLVVEQLVNRRFLPACYQPHQLKNAIVYLLISLAALMLHPNGLDLFKTVYSHIFSDVVTGSYVWVEEHQPLVLKENVPYLVLVGLAGLSFLVRRENFRILTLLFYLAFVVLSFGSMRYVALSAFVMAAVIGLNLGQAPSAAPPERADGLWVRPAGLLALSGFSLGLLFWTFQGDRVYEFGLGVNQSRYPYAAVKRLESLKFSGNIYNSWRFGGFLQWHLPGAKTFIDGRCLPEQLQLFDRFAQIDLREFARYMADNHVQAALIDRSNQRDVAYFNEIPGFRLAHMDDLAVLFVRSELLGAQERSASGVYRYLRLGGYDYEYLAELAQRPEAPLVENELNSALQSSPDNFFVNFLLAFFYDAKGDSRAVEQYLFAASKNPQFAHTHFAVGVRAGRAALKFNDWEHAVQAADESLNYQKTGELYFIRGVAEQKLGRLEDAEVSYRSSLQVQGNPLVMNNLGFLLLERNDHDAAKGLFSQLLEEPDGGYEEAALYGLALACSGAGDAARALAVRDELLKKYPGSRYVSILNERFAR